MPQMGGMDQQQQTASVPGMRSYTPESPSSVNGPSSNASAPWAPPAHPSQHAGGGHNGAARDSSGHAGSSAHARSTSQLFEGPVTPRDADTTAAKQRVLPPKAQKKASGDSWLTNLTGKVKSIIGAALTSIVLQHVSRRRLRAD